MPYSPFTQSQRLDSAALSQNLPWFGGWGGERGQQGNNALPPTQATPPWAAGYPQQATTQAPQSPASTPPQLAPGTPVTQPNAPQFYSSPVPEEPPMSLAPNDLGRGSWWSQPAPKFAPTAAIMPKYGGPPPENNISLDPRENSQFENDWWNAAKNPPQRSIMPLPQFGPSYS